MLTIFSKNSKIILKERGENVKTTEIIFLGIVLLIIIVIIFNDLFTKCNSKKKLDEETLKEIIYKQLIK